MGKWDDMVTRQDTGMETLLVHLVACRGLEACHQSVQIGLVGLVSLRSLLSVS